ncbi:MAG: coproporphyrinogen dehydrogenase HemZ [Lachnospiraceae bacterium]|nr:coproporphyrinogen dehydrogenase HemZ [Lachnospiraceae bacterium]
MGNPIKLTEDKVMIVRVDIPGLQYDINAIVKAFYPDKQIRVIEPGVPVSAPELLELPVFMNIRTVDEETGKGRIDVFDKTYEYEIDRGMGVKNSFKLKLYDVMCEITGKTLPWGNLTGVRPTKIAMTRIREGKSDDEIMSYMTGHHKVSREKAELAINIAHHEEKLLSKIDPDQGFSLYINIPFCPTKCLYCSFASFPYSLWEKRMDEYLAALFKEIDLAAGIGSPDTVYIGGGTPTSLDEKYLDKLLGFLTDRIDVAGSLEFTCEAGRPDSINRTKLDILKKYGVTRISVNPQTMQQKTLDIIGRKTTPDQVIRAYHEAREAGFDNINMDMILGLPGEEICDVEDTLKKISDLGPDSLTVHSLAVKRASALNQRLDEIGIESLKNTDETMKLAADTAKSLGMEPYYLYRQKNMSGNFENIGYSVPGKEGIYNILIMEEVQSIVALGAGAISKKVVSSPASITRAENPKDVDNYISRIDEMIQRKKELFAL